MLDTCMYGLGGFTSFRTSWRLKIDSRSLIYGNDTANNALEFLELAITLWLLPLDWKERALMEELILSLAENTSATSWVFQSSLSTDSIYYNMVNFIAQKVAALVIESGNFLLTQHILGEKNLVCDWMTVKGGERRSYGNNTLKINPVANDCPSSDEITHRFHYDFPQLIQRHFRISHLPSKVLSFAQKSVQMLELSLIQKQKEDGRVMTEYGEDEKATVQSTVKRYCVGESLPLMEYRQKISHSSYGPFLKCTEKPSSLSQEKFLENVRNCWRESLLGKPQALWLRRSMTVLAGVPFTTTEISRWGIRRL